MIEVIVAIGIMVLVTAALTPQVVAGLRAAGTARDITQAKGLAQARLEQIRNTPYYVERAAGDYIDVLDTYYRNTTAPATAATGCSGATLTVLPPEEWTGHVAAAAGACAWEPTPPFYRRVINPIEAPGLGAFAMVVSTRFLSSITPPAIGATSPATVPPIDGYNSQVAGKDVPASPQIEVTVAVFYRTQGGVRYTSTTTQVESASPIDPLVASQAKVTALAVSSASTFGTLSLQQLGVLDLGGEVSNASRVTLTAAAGTASTSDEYASGAYLRLVAPMDITTSQSNDKEDAVLSDDCIRMCFGKTRVDQATAMASNGLPRAGSATAPVRAYIQDSTKNSGFSFRNGATLDNNPLGIIEMPDKTLAPMVSLKPSETSIVSHVSNCAVTGSAHAAALMGAGHLDATSASVESCTVAQSTTIRLFPTTFAPHGVVQIILRHATAKCRVERASNVPTSVTADYQATVRYKIPPDSDPNSYETVDLNGSTAFPLGGNGKRLQTKVSRDRQLSAYIASWKSLVSTEFTKTLTDREARARIPGAITIVTKPTRNISSTSSEPDPRSAISLSIGSVSCQASDFR